jgi:Tfp pilus assembly protein FimT
MKKSCPGFTLIELLLILSLTGLLFSLGMAQYSKFNRRQTLNKAKDELISNLRLAQSKALAAEKPAVCGAETVLGHQLKFVDNHSYKIVVACGDDPEGYPEVKQAVLLPEGITKTSAEDIVFFRVLSQGVDEAVSITLSGFNETRMVTITTSGEIK